MERLMTVEERIRRAEDIYNNRINSRTNLTSSYGLKNNCKRNCRLKKMILQIIVCSLLYSISFMIAKKEYIVSNDFRNGLNSLINTQMDFNKVFNDGKSYLLNLFSTNNVINVENIEKKENNNENSDEQNEDFKKEVVENSESESKNENENDLSIEDNTSNIENIGGADIQNEGLEYIRNDEDTKNEEIESDGLKRTQMEMDAEDIKNSISFEMPIDGYISSSFGIRNPTTSSVPKNHTGIDIAATAGTVIKSATDGIVVLASSYGDFGNHYKIQIDDVTIIYAHCKKLYLKEGDRVTQGQEIAEVGSTGNSTGPHLHFEIRKEGRLVDPQLILNI